jgi:hypothetical protein
MAPPFVSAGAQPVSQPPSPVSKRPGPVILTSCTSRCSNSEHKAMLGREPYQRWCVVREVDRGLCNAEYRVFPPTIRHLRTAIANRFLGRSVQPIDRDGTRISDQGHRACSQVELTAGRGSRRFSRSRYKWAVGVRETGRSAMDARSNVVIEGCRTQNRQDRLCAPLCAQCHGPMIIVICEPDFENSMMATYRCSKCGLLDRAQIQ